MPRQSGGLRRGKPVVAVINDTKIDAEIEVDVLIVGGGAAGLTAALAANEAE